MVKSLNSISKAIDRIVRCTNINTVEFKVVDNIDNIIQKCKLLGIKYEKIEKDTYIIVVKNSISIISSEKIALNSTGISGILPRVQLDTLDVSGINFDKLVDISFLFQDLYAKEFKGFESKSGSIERINHLFHSACIDNLDLTNFNTSNVRGMVSTFESFEGSIIGLETFNTSNVLSMKKMFYKANIKNEVSLRNFKCNNLKHNEDMFSFCSDTIKDRHTIRLCNLGY